MKLNKLLKRSRHFARKSRSIIPISIGKGRKIKKGGYRKIATPYLHAAKSSSSFFQRNKGKMLNAAKLLGTLGTAYLAYKYRQPREVFEDPIGREASEMILRQIDRAARPHHIVRFAAI
jgi:hypothetical protein